MKLWENLLEDDSDFAEEFNHVYDNSNVAEANDKFLLDLFNVYLNMELAINQGKDNSKFA